MAPPPPFRAAIIGYGISGELSHAAGLKANPNFEIAAVCDTSEARCREAERDLGCTAYTDYHKMLRRERLDLVSVVTRTDTHRDIACDCLQAGVHTLVTKPLAPDLPTARQIVDTARRTGRLLFPWLPTFWSPDFRKIRELLAEGAIGDVFLIRRSITGFRRRHDWQTELRYGGGYLRNWGAHIVQPLLALADSPLESVHGHLSQAIDPGDAEDNFLAVLHFKNGTRGMAEYTQALDGLSGFLVQGTQGTISSDQEKIVLLQKDPASADPPRKTVFPIEGNLYGDDKEIYADVARALRHEAPFPVSPDIALYGTAVLDAIRQSHSSRQLVSLGRDIAP